MVSCLPSNLENFVPPPSEQRSQPPPWRGSFVVRGANSDRNITQEIFVTAVETDGEKYVDESPLGIYMLISFFVFFFCILAGHHTGQRLFMFVLSMSDQCYEIYKHGSRNVFPLCLSAHSCPIAFENKTPTRSIKPTFVRYHVSSSKIKRFVLSLNLFLFFFSNSCAEFSKYIILYVRSLSLPGEQIYSLVLGLLFILRRTPVRSWWGHFSSLTRFQVYLMALCPHIYLYHPT